MRSLTTLGGRASRRFLRHFVEMIVAKVGGMIVLGALESVLPDPVCRR